MKTNRFGESEATRSSSDFGDVWAKTNTFVSELGLQCIGGAQYVECRLGSGHDQLDYLCAVSRLEAGYFHESLLAYAHGRAAAENPGWRAVLRLLREWANDSSPINATAPGIWLEFDDVGRDDPQCATPSISIGLVPGYRFDRPFNPSAPHRDLPSACAALRAVGVDSSEEIARTLSNCFAQLPEAGRWVHLSVMLGRTPSAIKLYGAIPREALLPYLRAIGWRGDHGAVSRLMSEAYGPELVGEEVFVDLNLENYRDEARCSLGLAVAQQHVIRGPHPDPRRKRVLERWVSLGLADCSRTQRVVDGLGDQADVFRLDGRFLDLKLVWQAGRVPAAKAYLGSHRGGRVGSA
jgi:hypothetical protein